MKLAREDIEKIYKEIDNRIDGWVSYHVWNCVGCPDWDDNGNLVFTVLSSSDEGDGDSWQREWIISDDGSIFDGENYYKSLDEFKEKY